MAAVDPPASPPVASTSALPSRGSPSASRIAAGRPVPLPLDLAYEHGQPDYAPSTATADEQDSSEAGPSGAGSPMTPDRAGAGSRAGGGEQERGGEETLRMTVGAGSSGQGGQWGAQGASSGAGQVLPAATTSSRGASYSKLPPSTSSASLSARPRQTLGYTSSSRRNGSPSRGPGGLRPEALSSSNSPSQAAGSSRFLLTVVPPKHLPHDPPHPRTNPQCSGYGPPEHFRRGCLVPLYPTLSAQLAAIAREYGLPSIGGLVLYLLSTTDPYSQGPMPGSAALAGDSGPRINEEAWHLLWSQLFAEEEELMMLRDDELSEEDEDDFAPPPVPPIPLSHATLNSSTRQPTDENGVFSDDNERVSQSSDAGASGSSVYSNGLSSDVPKSRQNSSSAPPRRVSARGSLGHGPPPSASLASPNGAKRFTSMPTSSHHLRHSSRHSIRSTSHSQRPSSRSTYAYPPPMSSLGARSASYGSYSPSLSPLPAYGASVVVGKVEFDIHASARGGQWYEKWLAGASSGLSSAIPSSLATPSIPSASEPWQELHLPGIVASKTPQVQGLGFDEDFTPAAKPVQLPEVAPVGDEPVPYDSRAPPDMRLRSPSGQSRGMETATSSFSLAALAEHVPDQPQQQDELDSSASAQDEHQQLEEQDAEANSSIVDKLSQAVSRSSSSLPSRTASNASSYKNEPSEKGTDDTPLLEDGDLSYRPLSDGEDEEEDGVDSKPDGEREDGSSDDSAYGDEDEENAEQQEPSQADQLADVFESDEATWQSLAADDSVPPQHERDAIETTGLGISGARVAELEASAAEGVLERLPEQETLDEQGLPPPQDDIADVAALLGASTSSERPKGNLASPIRLSSSAHAAELTGVFPPSPVQGADGHDSPSTSPFAKTHSTRTSISTVQFSVRPPSTVASMSPEFVPLRKQRQGWTNIPPVVDPPMSNSSSTSSIAPLAESQRASTIGLMENLDDLERALAELSPRAGAAAAMARAPLSPETIMEASPAAEETGVFAPPPRTSSASSTAPPPAGRSLNSRPAFRYGMLSSPPEITPPAIEEEPSSRFEEQQLHEDVVAAVEESLTSSIPGYEHDSPREVAATTAVDVAPVAAVSPIDVPPVVEPEQPTAAVARSPSDPIRIPRSSSLNKPEAKQQQQQQLPAQLVALPPSPMPEQHSTLTLSAEPQEPYQPFASTSSAGWPAPPPLPPRKEDEDELAFPAPPPRSPGGLKSFRSGKWGSKGKSLDTTSAAKMTSPEPAEDNNGGKSPLGTFFGKSTFGKAKGFFRRGDCTFLVSLLSSAILTNSTLPDAANSPDSPNPMPLPTESAVSPPLPSEPVLPPRKESLDLSAPPFPTGRARRPSVSAGSQPRDLNEPLPPFPSALAANASASSSSPQPPFLGETQPFESFRTAQTTLPSPSFVAPLEAFPSLSTASPAAAYESDSADLPPPPPIYEAGISSPSTPDYLLASPRSDYIPSTPRAGASASSAFAAPSYPASAPVTPADWRNTPGGTARRPRGARQHRLSADIDQLLSQMNELDFSLVGGGGGAAGGEGEEQEVIKEEVAQETEERQVEEEKEEKENVPPPVPEEALSTHTPPTAPSIASYDPHPYPQPQALPNPLVVEPEPDVSDAYDGGLVAPPSPERRDDAPLFGAGVEDDESKLRVTPGHNRGQDSQGRPFPLSEDLSALGSMMTGLVASPPMSPESVQGSSYIDYPASSTAPPAPTVA
ncbi:hypothetical protein JCM8097_004034 [Rhodosporidiobolus ruineniae]